MAFTAAAIGGSALIGGITSLIGSSQAAGAAKSAANLAAAQKAQTRGDLLPYNTAGQNMLDPMAGLARDRTGGGPDYVARADSMLPGQMTQAELEATPGYQFTRDQGLKAVASSASARGLGVSGAALKGAGGYATGLANSTYKDQFNIQQQRYSDVLGLNTAQQGNITNQFNRMSGLATLGENAGAQTGSVGASLANTAGNALQASGIDTAAGYTGIGSAVTGGLQSYINNQNYNNLMDTIKKSQAGYGAVTAPSVPAFNSTLGY